MNRSLALEVSRTRKVGSQRTPPPRVRTPRLNEMVHQINPPLTLSKGKVSSEPSLWVRGLENGKCRFIKNTSPSCENAKDE